RRKDRATCGSGSPITSTSGFAAPACYRARRHSSSVRERVPGKVSGRERDAASQLVVDADHGREQLVRVAVDVPGGQRNEADVVARAARVADGHGHRLLEDEVVDAF